LFDAGKSQRDAEGFAEPRPLWVTINPKAAAGSHRFATTRFVNPSKPKAGFRGGTRHATFWG